MDFSIHLNRGTHMVTSLYNISSNIRELYKIFHYFGITKTHLQNNSPCLWPQTLSNNLFRHFPELHQKSEHFWTFLSSSPSSNPFEFQMSLNLNLSVMPTSIFPGSSLFLRVRENYPHAQIFSLTLSFFFFSLIVFC